MADEKKPEASATPAPALKVPQGAEVFKGPQNSTPAKIPASKDRSKMHVDLYLHATKARLWHRGGKRAYAIKKGMTFASEQEFAELFKKY